MPSRMAMGMLAMNNGYDHGGNGSSPRGHGEPKGMAEPLIDRMPEEIDALARNLLERACEQKLTLATAESCTGGLIAAILTDVEGASHAFERGFIVYSDEAKAGLLGIRRDLIDAEGAVSAPVALEMAKGALSHSAADIVLAVTGFAGAAGAGDEPGLVHLACIRRGRDPWCQEEHFGDAGRSAVRLAAVRTALEMMTAALV